MSPEEARLSRLVESVLDDLDWKAFAATVGEIRIVPRRARPFSPLIESLRSVSDQYLVTFPLGGGPDPRDVSGDLLPHEWSIVIVIGDKTKPVTRVNDAADDSSILAKIADGLQNAILNFTTEACPPCPVHRRHPLNIVEVGGNALWLCKNAQDGWSCRVGEYKASVRAHRRQGGGNGRKRA